MKKLYSNCKLKAPDGSFLAFMDEKRAKWYLKKNLGVAESENPLVVRLNFLPKGPGNKGQEYFENPLENQCVVCGNKEELTKHHCVPLSYRKFMSKQQKSHNNHDVLALCKVCHRLYETAATTYKKELCAKYNVVYNKQPSKDLAAMKKACLTLLNFELDESKYNELYALVEKFLGKKPTEEDLWSISDKKETLDHSSELMAHIVDHEAFCREWRTHFVESMSPRFLPKGWSVDFKRV